MLFQTKSLYLFIRKLRQDDVWMILDGEMTQHRRAYQAAREQEGMGPNGVASGGVYVGSRLA